MLDAKTVTLCEPETAKLLEETLPTLAAVSVEKNRDAVPILTVAAVTNTAKFLFAKVPEPTLQLAAVSEVHCDDCDAVGGAMFILQEARAMPQERCPAKIVTLALPVAAPLLIVANARARPAGESTETIFVTVATTPCTCALTTKTFRLVLGEVPAALHLDRMAEFDTHEDADHMLDPNRTLGEKIEDAGEPSTVTNKAPDAAIFDVDKRSIANESTEITAAPVPTIRTEVVQAICRDIDGVNTDKLLTPMLVRDTHFQTTPCVPHNRTVDETGSIAPFPSTVTEAAPVDGQLVLVTTLEAGPFAENRTPLEANPLASAVTRTDVPTRLDTSATLHLAELTEAQLVTIAPEPPAMRDLAVDKGNPEAKSVTLTDPDATLLDRRTDVVGAGLSKVRIEWRVTGADPTLVTTMLRVELTTDACTAFIASALDATHSVASAEVTLPTRATLDPAENPDPRTVTEAPPVANQFDLMIDETLPSTVNAREIVPEYKTADVRETARPCPSDDDTALETTVVLETHLDVGSPPDPPNLAPALLPLSHFANSVTDTDPVDPTFDGDETCSTAN